MTIIDMQEYTATVGATALEVTGGTVTLDDSWAPYIQGRITIVTPTDTSILDPRELPTLNMTLRQRFGDGLQFASDLTALYSGGTAATVTAQWGGWLTSAITALIGAWNDTVIAATSLELKTLYITDRTITADTGTTELVLASGEHRPQQLRAAIRLVIGETVSTLRQLFPKLSPGTLAVGEVDTAIAADDLAPIFGVGEDIAVEQDQWTPLQGFAQQAALRLWVHPDGQFRLTPRWEQVPGLINLDRAIQVEERTSRFDETWADGVIVKYQEHPLYPDRGIYEDSTGIESATKVAIVDVAVPSPYDGVYTGNLANTILERMLTRGRVLEVTHVSRFDTAPNVAIAIDQPALGWLPPSEGFVDAVTFDLTARTMRVTVRDLQEA